MLTQRESQGLLPALGERKIPVRVIRMNPEKRQPVGPALGALLSKVPEVREGRGC